MSRSFGRRMHMSDYPPKLVQIAPTAFGSLLTPSDGRGVPINVGPDRLGKALAAYHRPPLVELVAAHSLHVYADTWRTTDEDWQRVSAIVHRSPVAAGALRQAPSVWDVFGQPAVVVRGLPQRVYGGLEQGLYPSHPFGFGPDPNRPAPWVRGLLSAPGGRLFTTWVRLDGGRVEVEGGIVQGHFVE